MTTFADERWERDVERFSPFRRLWKTDDENWITARKEAWRTAYGRVGGDPWTLCYGKFYVYGEEPPRCFVDDTGREVDSGFDLNDRIAFTPFETADPLRRFWETMARRNPPGAGRDHGRFRNIGESLDRFPDRDRMVKLVTETMFSPELFMRSAEGNAATRRNRITVDPRDFAVGYTNVSSFYHKANLHGCDYRNFSHEYFLLSVRYCEENDASEFVDDLIKMYEFLVALDDSKLSQYRLELKHKLISAAEGDNVPASLSEALKAARKSQIRWSFYSGYKQYLQASRVEPRRRLRKPRLPG